MLRIPVLPVLRIIPTSVSPLDYPDQCQSLGLSLLVSVFGLFLPVLYECVGLACVLFDCLVALYVVFVIFRKPWLYRSAIVADLFLRFTWAITLVAAQPLCFNSPDNAKSPNLIIPVLLIITLSLNQIKYAVLIFRCRQFSLMARLLLGLILSATWYVNSYLQYEHYMSDCCTTALLMLIVLLASDSLHFLELST